MYKQFNIVVLILDGNSILEINLSLIHIAQSVEI